MEDKYFVKQTYKNKKSFFQEHFLLRIYYCDLIVKEIISRKNFIRIKIFRVKVYSNLDY